LNRVGFFIKIFLLASGMILTAALSTWVVFAFLTRGGEVTVPDLSNLELKAALERASGENLGLRVSGTGYDPGVPPGHVISQDPGPGIRTKKNRIVRVVVSQGTRTVFVPKLTGRNLRNAELILTQAGLNLGRVGHTFHPDTSEGQVITQYPSPDLFVPRSTAVDILLSEGPRPVIYLLPDPMGLPVEEVLSSLRGLGLQSGRVLEVDSADLPPGTVTKVTPAPGSPVTKGQSIHLTVSKVPTEPEHLPLVLFQYSIPPGLLDRTLTLELETGDGSVVIWEETVGPGTSVSVPVNVPAPGVLKAYLDRTLVEEREVP